MTRDELEREVAATQNALYQDHNAAHTALVDARKALDALGKDGV